MHLVIPFASALSDAAGQALGTLALPNLERLLGRWAAEPAPADDIAEPDEYSLSPPHERVLARVRGWPVVDGLLPFAAEAARADGLAVAPGSGWGLLTPTHWLVGRDQINLMDPATLTLGEDEARTLFETLRPLFEDLGWQLHWAGPARWHASHPSLAALPTASIDRVIGRNVDLWLNDHPGILVVRRLQSEAQMLLYVHPLNDAREARGLRPVNSFWLSGTGPAPQAAAAPPADLVVDDRLRAPALAEDWAAWAEAWAALDAGPLRTLASADGDSPATAHRLTLCGERRALSWRPVARPWWKNLFGARPAAQATLAEL
ncbi:MAG TPA: hypothetical protein VIP05_19165 [Burkholderiaceae bacterium]